MAKLSGVREVIAYHLTQPAVRFLARTSITPSVITWFGFSVSIGAAVLIATEHIFAAGFVVLFSGFLDILDGALARHTNQVTRFGSVLDSTLDRVSDAVPLLGILVFYLFFGDQSTVGILLVCLALIGSPLVSYIRARAEALGLDCKIGLFTRAERIIVLAVGLLLSQIVDYALIIALAIIVVFSFVTAGQRLVYVWQQTKTK